MLVFQLVKNLLIQRSVIPKPTHFLLQTTSVKQPKNIHQVINLLFISRTCK